MRIALDIDRVLADFDVRLAHCVKKLYGFELVPSDIVMDNFKALFCLNKREEQVLFEEVFSSIDHFPVVEGAIEGCEILLENDVEVFLVTARIRKVITYEWLNYYFPKFNFPVYFKESMDEIPLADYFLDDSPYKIAQYYGKITRQCFLMDSYQNKGCVNLGGKYQRVYGWFDFLDRIQKDNPHLQFRRISYARK